MAASNRDAMGGSSTALLALRRWFRRSLKQMGAGLLSLILVLGAVGHNQPPLNSVSSSSGGLQGSQQSVVPAVLIEGDKPFQALRPKMTYHRLTTSRLSIPAENARTMARLASRELDRETK